MLRVLQREEPSALDDGPGQSIKRKYKSLSWTPALPNLAYQMTDRTAGWELKNPMFCKRPGELFCHLLSRPRILAATPSHHPSDSPPSVIDIV